MKLRKLLLSTTAAGMLAVAGSAQAAIITDFIFVVDESGSMSDVQTNLRAQIGNFASVLSGGGVNALYGLVGYGNNSINPRRVTDLTTAANFATAAGGLVASGGWEPGYTATAFALNQLDNQSPQFTFRPDSIINIILMSDEPSNYDGYAGARVNNQVPSLAIVDDLLDAEGALFNAMLSGSNTIASYQPLADNHGGQVFDLSAFATLSGAALDDFVRRFAEAKLAEVQDYCDLNPNDPACQGGAAPLPGTLSLLGLGLASLRLRRRPGSRRSARPLAAALA